MSRIIGLTVGGTTEYLAVDKIIQVLGTNGTGSSVTFQAGNTVATMTVSEAPADVVALANT